MLALCLALVAGPAARAGEVRVVIDGVRDEPGEVRVAACDEAHFLASGCFRSAVAPARAGTVQVVLSEVPPGTYALQAFHDANRDGAIDTNLFGMPREGMGFSNDAPMRFGPPDFADAAVEIGAGDTTIRFTMRYFDG